MCEAVEGIAFERSAGNRGDSASMSGFEDAG